MKRLLLAAAMAIVGMAAYAQNIQLHYDLGSRIYSDEEEGRAPVTLTLEQFKADEWGSWFYFVDVDLSHDFTEGAYAEISREITLGRQSPLAVHAEYNGGLNRFGSFQQAALAGLALNGHSEDYAKTWAVQLMYKQYFRQKQQPIFAANDAYASVQLTGVWSTTFAHKHCTFSGYIDFWRGKDATGKGQLVTMTEPQLWYNLSSHLSVGTEVEISNNFINNPANGKTFFVNPTIAAKWRL